MTEEDFDEDRSGYRKVRGPKKQKRQEIPTVKIEYAVVTTQDIPIKVLSEKLPLGTFVSIAFSMNINTYQGTENLQLILKDIKF